MSEHSTTQCVLFPGIFRKPVVAQFDQHEGSSDGGAVLLKAADGSLGLVDDLTTCLQDRRQAGKVDHSLRELLAQRVFSIACGYPDANDSARLASDPIHKLLLDRDPVEGSDLASQPTLSRFENGVGSKELYGMSEALARTVLRRHAKRLRRRAYRVTIDLDPTDDPTHGAQQLSFFNGHYDSPAVLNFLDSQPKLEYVVAMAKNSVLKRIAAPGVRRARQLSRRSGKTEHIYGEVGYAARKWRCQRRVVIKAEVVRAPGKDPRDNPRFVITNLKQSPQWIYEQVYCQRGDIENRIKLRPAKALELTVWQRRIDQTVCPIGRSLRGRSGEATDRSKPSDNVPTLARVASEPRGDGVSASIRRRGARLGGKVRLHKCS